MPQTFKFRAIDVFGIYRRGVVFHGFVTEGQLRPGEHITFAGTNRTHRAKVYAIELNRKLIEQTVQGADIGLLLSEFEDPQVDARLAFDVDADGIPPPLETVLGIELPIELVGA